MTKFITKKLQLFMAILLILALSTTTFAEPIQVLINNQALIVPVNPVIEQERTLVPLRAIFEALGVNVDWDQKTKTVTGTRDDKIIKLQIDNKIASINGTNITLDVPARIINESTLVPVRFIAESLGAHVTWNQQNQTVLILSDYIIKTYKVVRVVDGDTIKVNFNGIEESLRLIGIDTPESVHPDADKNIKEGIIASDYTKSMLEGKEVRLEFDVQQRDRYGRLLAYVWLGNKMFNKTLLDEGYAQVSTYPPNVKYVSDFVELERIARENNKGLWKQVEAVDPNVPVIVDKSTNPTGPMGNKDTAQYKGSLKSDKYHFLEYSHSGQIVDHNLIYFESKDHAIANGYKPCGICFK